MKEKMLITLSHTLKGFLTESSATKVIQKALVTLDSYFHASYSYLALQDKETSYIDIKYSHGVSQNSLKNFHKKVGSKTIGRIFFKDAFTVVKRAENLGDYNELKIEDDYEMCVAMHIGWGGRTFGYLSCYFDHEFDIDVSATNFLLSMAGACSAALEKQEMVEIIRELKQYDSETGSYSHQYFMSKLEDEILQCYLNNRIMSLIVMDLDNYKKIVNTYGPGTGRELLKSATEELKAYVRGCDVLGSLGIDEFALYMPGIAKEEATKIIRDYSRNLSLLKLTSNEITTSFSFGITQLHESSDDIEKIMHRAQLALYNARKKGAGHVCVEE